MGAPFVAALRLPPLALVVVAFLLRQGTGGLGDPVDYEALLLLPVLWFALYGSRSEMLTAVALGGLSFALSLAIQPAGGGAWVKAVIWPTVTALVGVRVHALVHEIGRLSQTDHLTGIPNRARWDIELAREAARSERAGTSLTVGLIDMTSSSRPTTSVATGPAISCCRVPPPRGNRSCDSRTCSQGTEATSSDCSFPAPTLTRMRGPRPYAPRHDRLHQLLCGRRPTARK